MYLKKNGRPYPNGNFKGEIMKVIVKVFEKFLYNGGQFVKVKKKQKIELGGAEGRTPYLVCYMVAGKMVDKPENGIMVINE
jgi:hypothetical protein